MSGQMMGGQMMGGQANVAERSIGAQVGSVDPIWDAVRDAAERAMADDPTLCAFMGRAVLNHASLEAAVADRVAERLHHQDVPADALRHEMERAAARDPEWGARLRIDVQAVFDRDPACHRHLDPVLYFKGFHALQAHRLAHALWGEGRRDLALYVQSRMSSVFQVDIHPATRVGRGVFIDHGTGIVVGETAVIGDRVSILQGVTLGGTGKEWDDRHPKVRSGVLIGANASVLGNIEIGTCSKIAAGSVVVKPVPPNTTVAGVPAKVIGEAGCDEPSAQMNQLLGQVSGPEPDGVEKGRATGNAAPVSPDAAASD